LNQASAAEVVEELNLLVSGDGAAITLTRADPERAQVEVSLDLSGVSCEECVLPPDLLQEMIRAEFSRRFPEELEVVVVDPRS
jgi:Fe-S cluster biogenesis protein NfuA